MRTRALLGLLGGVLLTVGVFMPVVNLSILGAMTFYPYSNDAGRVVLAAGALAILLALVGQERFLWLPGAVALVVTGAGFISVQRSVNGARDQLLGALGLGGQDTATAPIRDFVSGAVQLQWGWAVLFIGALILVAGAFVKSGVARRAI